MDIPKWPNCIELTSVPVLLGKTNNLEQCAFVQKQTRAHMTAMNLSTAGKPKMCGSLLIRDDFPQTELEYPSPVAMPHPPVNQALQAT